jgi:diacylglycerol kinase family enzyme
MIRIILNGKKAGYESVRTAIASLREERDDIGVRVTYEYGDVERFLNEAVREGVKRLIVGGGDGSVNVLLLQAHQFP